MTPLLVTFVFYVAVESSVPVKPVVTFTPDWANILIYESVTITCNVGPAEQENRRYYWYKDNKPIREHQPSFTIHFADDRDLGEYRCRTNTSQRSDPARLGVIGNLLILQRPLVIYEGDPFTLRCHSSPRLNATNTTFYKNGTLLQFSLTNDKLHFTKADRNTAGTYHCTKEIFHNNKVKNVSAETYVSVESKILWLDKRQTAISFPWIPVLIALLVTCVIGYLLFRFRHKLSPLISGGLQNYPVTEPGVQNKAEEDVIYSSIDTDNLQKECPAPRRRSDDYSITYSHVTRAGSTPEGTSTQTVYDVIRFK